MKFIKELIPYIIIILVVVLVRTFIISPVSVDGKSMYPTLNDNDYLLLEKFDRNFKRYDIIVLNYNNGIKNEKLVKRIIGLPGDEIQYLNGILYINGEEVEEYFLDEDYVKKIEKTLNEKKDTKKQATFTSDFNIQMLGFDVIPDNYYLVLGDNRPYSTDSRIIGLINKKDITGKVIFNVFKFKTVK